MQIISEWSRVEEILGCSLRDNFLMPVRTLDNPKSCTPIIIDGGKQRWMVVPGIERGNVEGLTLPPDVTPLYMQRYFTFDDLDNTSMPRNLAEAVASVAGGAKELVVDAHLPVALQTQLAQSFSLSVEDAPDVGPVCVREVSKQEVEARLTAGRAEAIAAVKRLLERNPNRAALSAHLDATPAARFDELDRTLSEAGLAAVVVTSRINVQEIGGIPLASHMRPIAVVYAAGGKSAFVIERPGAGAAKQHASIGAAISAILPTGRVGIETEDMGVALSRAMGMSDRDHVPCDVPVRKWRDRIAGHDLAYYIIAARTSAHAIDNALSFASEAVKRGDPITEKDVDRVYFQGLQDHVASTGLPLRVTRFMTNLHSGTRSLYAANPTSYVITKEARTLKIDSGCLIYDKAGYLLGVSDIARTISFTPEGHEIYPLLVDGVRRHMIPAAKAGAVAEDVFKTGVSAVWDRRHELKSTRLTPEVAMPDVYKRDVGHLLGKNDLSHLRYIAGDKGVLREGMISCLEYQWPIDGHSLAYEDTCLVTAQGGLNFTSDAE
ncbi:MAG TPA: hypothetical protein VED01_14295 [Burkholderiales bacterium]|nr:hypothetical protein [Burkholderiales bacterium]